MSLITKVKAGSVSSLSDARYFAGMGVDWLGFNVNPQSDSYVNLELYRNIAGWVSGPKRVIEIQGSTDATTTEKIFSDYEPDSVELDIDQIGKLPSGMNAMVRANLARLDNHQLVNFSKQIEFLVLQVDTNPFAELMVLQEIARKVKILLSVRPDFQEYRKAIQELPIAGIALTGSRELKAGIKSYDYSEMLESLEDES